MSGGDATGMVVGRKGRENSQQATPCDTLYERENQVALVLCGATLRLEGA